MGLFSRIDAPMLALLKEASPSRGHTGHSARFLSSCTPDTQHLSSRSSSHNNYSTCVPYQTEDLEVYKRRTPWFFHFHFQYIILQYTIRS